jgi:hypothetical protein
MEEFIKKSKLKFGNTFSYNNLNYITSKKPVSLYCNTHNKSFTISTQNHLNTIAGGCENCDFDNRYDNFVKRSNEKYNDNFIINKTTFKDGNTKTEIRCTKHNNIFFVTLQKHLKQNNGGCSRCDENDPITLCDEIILQSNEKYNNNYIFTNFKYVNANTKSEIICKKHNNTINITPYNHIHSIYGGCNLCTMENKTVEKTKKKNAIDKKKIKSVCNTEKDEEFKILTLPNYENSYKISNYGKIFSLKNNIYMKLNKNNNGYMQVRLYDNNIKSKIFRVHQLVAYMFVENKDNKKFVDHIDRKRDNNYYKNLRWVTHKENMNNTNKKVSVKGEIINDINDFIKIGIIDNKDYSRYLINKDGKIICQNNRLRKTHINDGYETVMLVGIDNDNTKHNKAHKVHRLVAHVFIKKPKIYDETFVVNHIDENRLNNNYKNLEWCTSAENTKKYFSKSIYKKKENNKIIKYIGKFDIETDKLIQKYDTYTNACISLNVNKSNRGGIAYCCKGYRKTALGYKWKFITE